MGTAEQESADLMSVEDNKKSTAHQKNTEATKFQATNRIKMEIPTIEDLRKKTLAHM